MLINESPSKVTAEHVKHLKLCTEKYPDFDVAYRLRPFPHIIIGSEKINRKLCVGMKMFEDPNAMTYIDEKIKKYRESYL